jgi:hypothetical protein
MRNRDIFVFASLLFALTLGVSMPSRMQAQYDAESSTMLPLDQYLMDRDAEINYHSAKRGSAIHCQGRHRDGSWATRL